MTSRAGGRPAASGASAGESLEGTLDRVAFTNEENAWSVVKIAVPGRRDLVTAVGNLLGVQPGENLRLLGAFVSTRSTASSFASIRT